MQYCSLQLVTNLDEIGIHGAEHFVLDLLHQRVQVVAGVHVVIKEASIFLFVDTFDFLHQDFEFLLSDAGLFCRDFNIEVALADHLSIHELLHLPAVFAKSFDLAQHLEADASDCFVGFGLIDLQGELQRRVLHRDVDREIANDLARAFV